MATATATATMTQAKRPLGVVTPLGADALLITDFVGNEGISQLFRFTIDALADSKKEIAFDKLLGQKVTVRLDLPGGKRQFFNGICNRVIQGDSTGDFTTYQLEVVPQLWLLTKKTQSRIFQHLSVPDILKKVFANFDVAYELQGTFAPRDFCVQYRESDFDFASRLMEEEGIYYYFKHAEQAHVLVVANTPQSHADVPGPTKVLYEDVKGGARPEERVYSWSKRQDLASGKYALGDHSFELPHKHLEAEKLIADSVAVGGVTHKLKIANNDKLEIYDWPGGYAQRFDGIDRGGSEKPADVQKIFEDNKRTVDIRIQQEATPSLGIQGAGNCRHFTAGHKFTLATLDKTKEKGAKADGVYVLTTVSHQAHAAGDYRTGKLEEFRYENEFTCIPVALPFRPPQSTTKPAVQGSQTAVVVGPAGEEIFTDKYGRVKVQFHWDREGKNNADSSCWVRVATHWAGKQWGVVHIPRIGQEVVVDFLEGDPDQPIIVGSVYNAEMMPPFPLPDKKNCSGMKSNSTPGGGGYNEISIDDTKGNEKITIHGQFDMNTTVEHDQTTTVHNNRTETVDVDETITIHGKRTETVDKDETITVHGKREETVDKDETITVHGKRTETVDGDETITIHGKRTETVDKDEAVTILGNSNLTVDKEENTNIKGNCSLTVKEDYIISVTGGQSSTTKGDHGINAVGQICLDSENRIVLAVGGSKLTISAAGIEMVSTGTIKINGATVNVNC